MFVSPQAIHNYGLAFLKIRCTRCSDKTKLILFQKHYGSSPLDLADIWMDLTIGEHLSDEFKLTDKEKSEKGLKRYMIANFWLWAYPRNADMLASRFQCCEKYCRGKDLWVWVKRIAELKSKKITPNWDKYMESDEHMEILALSCDGTDFKINEPMHPTLNRDSKACSQKFKHAGAKYKIALSVHCPKVLHIAGPFKGGVNDLQMYRSGGLKEKLTAANRVVRGVRRVKLMLVDRGYKSERAGDQDYFALPNEFDSKELYNSKSRGRLRHETFNARLKMFSALAHQFRHGFSNHKFVFEAIVVIVQYQMDNGSPIYVVR